MGQSLARERLIQSIACGDYLSTRSLLSSHPSLANEPLNAQHSTPLIFAASIGDPQVVKELLAVGTEVDAREKEGKTALMISAQGGKTSLVDLLLQAGASVDLEDRKGFSALDFAIANGHYSACKRLISAGAKPKSSEFYCSRRVSFVGKMIDFEEFFQILASNSEHSDFEVNQLIFVDKPSPPPQMFDPKESWGEFLTSMISFKTPKLVPISSVPVELRPENRRLASVRSLINWRGQNYLEDQKNDPDFQDFAQKELQNLPVETDDPKMENQV